MKFMNFVLMTFVLIFSVKASPHHKYEAKLRELSADLVTLKASHEKEIAMLKKEVEELKQVSVIYETDNHERNEQATLEWAKHSMEELRLEVREIRSDVNNSVLLRQLHVIRNELKQALKETSNVSQLVRTQESRIDKLDSEVGRLKYEGHQCRDSLAQLRAHFTKLSTEIKQVEAINTDNVILEPHEIRSGELKLEPTHKYRHNKMIHTQISRLARSQEQIEEYQQNLQTQLLDVQRRLDRFEEPNWNLLSAQVEFLQLESKMHTSELKNMSLRLSDLDKVHVSMLELREDVESIENKVDKTIPEFRKEISKLDVHVAQLTAQSSYLKEDQENLRQSVKAIAVSVSNNMDRAEIDRIHLKKINDSVNVLTAHTKQHFHRLNDHILKSEAMIDNGNETDTVPLPELMGEVRELEPAQHEYLELVNQLPRDCTSIAGPEGIYLIHPGREPIETWCVNGNTVIQRRYNGSVEFNRKFVAYEQGFGNAASEYWLGLKSMHQLTADNCSSMRIDMTDIYGASWYAQYDRFYVGDSDSGYVLEVNGFEGNASDAFEYQNKMEFSAIDRDRDISNTHCAGNYEGGWWFSHCQHVNINGKYTLGLTWFDGARNEWIAVATTEMRLFRRPGCA